MSRKLVLVMVLITVLVVILFVVPNVENVKASATIYIRADGSIDPSDAPIQRYEDLYVFADDVNDPIVVERNNIVIDGTGYTLHGDGSENGFSLTHINGVNIKNVNIEAFENGICLSFSSKNTILRNNITSNNGFGVYLYQSSNNTISGNNITNNGDGIAVYHSSNNTISRNNISANNWYGIEISYFSNYNSISGNNVTNNNYGMYLDNSSGNTISGNNMTNNNYGIHVAWRSSGNTISGNNVTNNDYGIYLRNSFNNKLSDNVMNGNRYNFGVGGYELHHFLHSVDVSNRVDGNPVYYWVNRHKAEVPLDAGYVALVNCTEITVTNVTLANNIQGLLLAYTRDSCMLNNTLTCNDYGVYLHCSSNNTVSVNTLTNNDCGIYLDDSSGITLSGNNLSANNWYGILFVGSSNNFIYNNNFINNTSQVYDHSWDSPSVLPSINIWDNGYPSGGNYWSNYAGVDLYSNPHQNATGSDGIADTPHVIDASNRDSYPLMASLTVFSIGIRNGVLCSASVISNSTVSNFQLSEKAISFSVAGLESTLGFCRVAVPNVIVQELWQGNFTVQVDERSQLENRAWTDGMNTYIYFTYQHQEMEITIISEFPSALILPMLMVFTMFVLFLKKPRAKTRDRS